MSDTKLHSLNSPSALARREACPGSYRLEKALPETQSDDADAGTLKHHAVCDMLAGLPDASGLKGSDLDAVIWCHDAVKSLMWPGAHMVNETYLDLRWWHPSIEGGTPDLVIVEDFVKALVIDFKFGFKRVLHAEENLQLACYAAGVRKTFDVEKVEVAILQPAFGLVDIGTPKPETYERARDAAGRALNPMALLHPGEHCRYCRANGRCPEQVAIIKSVDTTLTVENVAALPMEKVSELLAAVEDRNVKNIIGAMQARMLAALLAGHVDERFALKAGRGSRKWIGGVEALLPDVVKGLGKAVEDVYTKPELLSVAQVEKVVGKGNDAVAALQGLILKVDGKKTLERIAPKETQNAKGSLPTPQ